MIQKNSVFTQCIGDDTKQLPDDKIGKWITTATLSKVKNYFDKMQPHVEAGEVYAAKFSHKEDMYTSFFDNKPVFIAYCHIDKKSQLEQLLQTYGIKPQEWKTELQSIEDWKEGGKLYIEEQKALENLRIKILEDQLSAGNL